MSNAATSRVNRLIDELGIKGRSLRSMLRLMAEYANVDGRNIFPSIPTLANRVPVTRQHAQRLIHELEQSCAVIRQRIGRGRGHRPYWFIPMDDNALAQAQAQMMAKIGVAPPLQPQHAVKPAHRPRLRKTPWPPDFVLSNVLRQTALKAGVPAHDIQRQFEAFKAHAETNDRRCKVWPAAWRQWCLNYRPFAQTSRVITNGQSPAATNAPPPPTAEQREQRAKIAEMVARTAAMKGPNRG